MMTDFIYYNYMPVVLLRIYYVFQFVKCSYRTFLYTKTIKKLHRKISQRLKWNKWEPWVYNFPRLNVLTRSLILLETNVWIQCNSFIKKVVRFDFLMFGPFTRWYITSSARLFYLTLRKSFPMVWSSSLNI